MTSFSLTLLMPKEMTKGEKDKLLSSYKKCGHVGKIFYVPIACPAKAESRKEVARIARQFPRVKYHHWDAILNCKRVSKKAYEKQIRINDNDEYLKCKSEKEQKQRPNIIQERMVEDNHQKELMMKN